MYDRAKTSNGKSNGKSNGEKAKGAWLLRHIAARDRMPELGFAAFGVYEILLDYVNRETWTARPELRTIARRCGCSKNTVLKAITTLENVGLIKTTRRKTIKGKPLCNEYTLPLSVGAETEPTKDTTPPVVGSVSDQRRFKTDQIVGAETGTEPGKGNQGFEPASGGDSQTTQLNTVEIPDVVCPDLRSDDGDASVAEFIWGKILEIKPNAKPPNLDRWADEIRRMRQVDKWTHEEIRAVFRWANADTFWQSNILSPASLRKHFDKLQLKSKGNSNGIKRPMPRAGGNVHPDDAAKRKVVGVF